MRGPDRKYCANNRENEEIWIKYIDELYRVDTQPAQINAVTAEKVPRIKMWELRNAVKKIKQNRNHKVVMEDLILVNTDV